MTKKKKQALKKAGWKVSSTPQELLGLTDEEMKEIERMTKKEKLRLAVKLLRNQ